MLSLPLAPDHAARLLLRACVMAGRMRWLYDPEQPRDEGGKWTSGSGLASIVAKISQPDGGFTYHAITGSQPTTGYVVSAHKGRERVIKATAYVLDNRELLGQDDNYLGGWHNPDDGKVYLDVSTVAQSAADAERIGRDANQLAYFDLVQGKSITIRQRLDRAAAAAYRRHRGRSYTQPHWSSLGAPHTRRFDRDGATLDRSRTDARGDRTRETYAGARRESLRALFDPNQPRAEDGKWTDTGFGSAPHLAEQATAGIAAGDRLLDRAVAEADYSSAGQEVESWDDVPSSAQDEVREKWINQAYENVDVDMSGVEQDMLNDLRRDNNEIIEETQTATLSALDHAFPDENPQLPGLEGDNYRRIDPETLTVDDDEGNGAPLVDLDQVRFTDGVALTSEEQALLERTWNDGYKTVFEERASNISDSDEWSERRNELESDAINQMWDDLSDSDKLSLAAEYDVSLEGSRSSVDPGEPSRWLTGVNKEDMGDEDYAKTHAIATKMTELRMAEVLAERGVGQTVNTEAFIEDTWSAWKASSHSIQSNALQLAAARELGGVHRLSKDELDEVNGSYDDRKMAVMQSYVRAQWETTQYVMSRADQHEVNVYRAILIPTQDAKREFYDSSGNKWDESEHARDAYGRFVKMPETSLLRAGAQSTTATPDVANSWGGTGKHTPGSERVVLRIKAPRTSVLSLPVFGENEQEEHELVLLGTKDKWKWDLWLGKAPTFDHPKLRVALRALAKKMARKNRKIVIDLQEADRKLPGHWLKGTNPGLTAKIAKVQRERRGLRDAEFNPEQERDERGRWSPDVAARVTALPAHPARQLVGYRVNPLRQGMADPASPAWTAERAAIEAELLKGGTLHEQVERASTEELDIDSLTSYQTWVNAASLQHKLGDSSWRDKPAAVVYSYGGKDWVVDGNNRLAILKLEGAARATVLRVGRPAKHRAAEFDPSQPRDESGRWTSGPGSAVAYHGTDDVFDVFDNAFTGKRTDPGFFGRGVYLVDDEGNAQRWGKHVIKANVKLDNPLFVSGMSDWIAKSGQQKTEGKEAYTKEITRVTKHLQSQGYDGVVITRSDGVRQYVVFDAEKIQVISHSGKLRGASTYTLSDLRGLGLARRRETKLHAIADSLAPRVEVAVRLAFAMGRRAIGRSRDASKAVLAIRKSLVDTLPKTLRTVYVEGGRVAGGMLRSAAFNPNQERDEQGRWTDGGGSSNSTSKTIAVKTPVTMEGADGSVTFETGKPVTFPYYRTPGGAPNAGGAFGQDIEPHGRYVSFREKGFREQVGRHETGTLTFQNPLLLDLKGAYGSEGWKARLSEAYEGKTGLALSKAVKESGHDGIVTVDPTSRFAYVGEIVDLTTLRGLELRTAKDAPKTKRIGPLAFTFNAASDEAIAWADRHAAELIDGITETSREAINNAIAEALEHGTDPYDDILEAVGSEERAHLIAHHEVMMAVHEGQREAWRQATESGLLTGTERPTWIVTGDDKVCPICTVLEDKTRDLDGPYETEDGEFDGPPAHPRCRCTEGLSYE